MFKKFTFILTSLFLFSCSNTDVEYKYPEKINGRYQRPSEKTEEIKKNTLFSKEGFDLFSSKEPENAIGVNTFLWQATLDSLSFMPLASADSAGGVVITDWYSPQSTPLERVKVTVLIKSKALRADGIEVSVFRQIKNEKNDWVDIATQSSVALKIENAILTKARELNLSNTK